MDVILSDPELSTFATSIIAAGLLDELTSANGFQYTVFAPTNAAFDAMLADMEITKTEFLSDPALLTAILSYHLLPGKLTSDQLQSGTVTTLSGASLTLSVNNSQVVVNDVSTVGPFVETGNGVVYVIEGVLIPPALRE
jgi:transforming growth factor-beta-induced protein